MNSASYSRSCCCGFYFSIRIGSIILLSLELTVAIIGTTWLLIELLIFSLKNGDHSGFIHKANIREATFIFIVYLPAQFSIIFGLVGIKKKKPSMLIPYFFCKSLILVGIVYELFVPWLIFLLSLKEADLLPLPVILKILFLVWNLYSFVVARMYYMELHDDLNRGQTIIHRPKLLAGAQRYTILDNEL